MGANNLLNKDGNPTLNDDIRLKLRQLREGIGYYESKSSVNRQSVLYQNNDASFESSRNGNNSSVLLPELKGSLSPGHYAA